MISQTLLDTLKQVVEIKTASNVRLNAQEIAEKMGVPVSRLRSNINSLRNLGFLTRDPSFQDYYVSIKALKLIKTTDLHHTKLPT